MSIGLMEGEQDLDVLVTPEDSTPLVGKDHPHFLSSLSKLLKDEPLMGSSMAPNVVPGITVPEENDSVQDNGNVTETVAAVKTHRQSAKEREEREKDDIAWRCVFVNLLEFRGWVLFCHIDHHSWCR